MSSFFSRHYLQWGIILLIILIYIYFILHTSSNLMHLDISRLIVSNAITSPIQVVCNYLLALHQKTLNKRNVTFFGTDKTTQSLTSDICGQLLSIYFIDRQTNPKEMTFTVLKMFVEFFCNQLVKFTESQFFTVESLEAMLGSTHNIREILVSVLLHVSIEFAHRAAGVSVQQV